MSNQTDEADNIDNVNVDHDKTEAAAELQKIRDALETINSHKFIRALNSAPRMIFFQFLRGIAFGLGSVIGATIVVSFLVYLLSQIEFIPIIGEWTQMILEEIQQENKQ